jgi:putative FmdB family regulatory protein
MPIYEYACDACGHEFEYLVRNGEAPVCPECSKSTELTRRLSVPAAHTSGSKSLPVCEAPPASTCGRPQCGMGGCQGLF